MDNQAETEEVDMVYDARESTWGHYFEWQKWLRQDNETNLRVASFWGHLSPRPEVGQSFIMIMGDSIQVVFTIEWIEHSAEQEDMFFCDATMLGAVVEEEVNHG